MPAFRIVSVLVEGAALTVMVTSSKAELRLSFAVSLRTYVPADENDATGLSIEASENVTLPGPDTLVHAVWRFPGGFGLPSSDADPASVAVAGSVIVWSGPAFTVGVALD